MKTWKITAINDDKGTQFFREFDTKEEAMDCRLKLFSEMRDQKVCEFTIIGPVEIDHA